MDEKILTSENINEMCKLAGFTSAKEKKAVAFGVGLAFGYACRYLKDIHEEQQMQVVKNE